VAFLFHKVFRATTNEIVIGESEMTREEIIAAVVKCTEELGHAPSVGELLAWTKVSIYAIRKNFGNYKRALAECGLERGGAGYTVGLESLFPDWAGVVRKLGRIPTMTDYRLHGRYSSRPLVRHFGGWRYVPAGMLEYGREQKLEDAWKDVLDVVAKHLMETAELPRASRRRSGVLSWPIMQADEPFYGLPMAEAPMVYCPTNEAGVAVLFGAVARELGFRITRVQNGFPDCEAMIEVEPGKLRPVRIEFEFESRNFLAHLHSAAKCDMIVCWRHNWPDCPLRVVELRSAVKGLIEER
jgi:HNH endonuclease